MYHMKYHIFLCAQSDCVYVSAFAQLRKTGLVDSSMRINTSEAV